MEITVSVPRELEAFIRERMEKADCETPEQVVWEALWLLRDVCQGRQARWEWLRAAIGVGSAQADRGETQTFDPEDLKRRIREHALRKQEEPELERA